MSLINMNMMEVVFQCVCKGKGTLFVTYIVYSEIWPCI